jgi:hypothetical protein
LGYDWTKYEDRAGIKLFVPKIATKSSVYTYFSSKMFSIAEKAVQIPARITLSGTKIAAVKVKTITKKYQIYFHESISTRWGLYEGSLSSRSH